MATGNNKPTFLGVGAMKAATTWLAECLRSHPDIFLSVKKEIHYFSHNWTHGYDWYLSHFDKVKNEKAIGEFSINYLYYPECCDRIYATLGEPKILISIRNPAERFVSHLKHIYRYRWNKGGLSIGHIGLKEFDRIVECHPNLLTKGIYYENICRYMDRFGENNIYVVFKDDIVYKPKEVVRQLYTFLGVNETFIPSTLNQKVNRGGVPRWHLAEQLKIRGSEIMANKSPSLLRVIRKMNIPRLYRYINDIKHHEIGIEEDVINSLLEYYRDDVENMEKLFCRDLVSWKTGREIRVTLEKKKNKYS